MTTIYHTDVPETRGYYSRTLTRELVSAETGAQSMTVWSQVLPEGGYVPTHYHPTEETIILLTGVIELTCDDETEQVASEATILIPAGVRHSLTNAGDEPARLIISYPTARPETFYDAEPRPAEWRVIRQAFPDEAERLTLLTWRSKAYWGYDASFMARARPELTITSDMISTFDYYVLEDAGQMIGYYSLESPLDGEIWLENLFVEPEYIGTGAGTMLLNHALHTARHMGYHSVGLEADPHAEDFYLRRGAYRFGERESHIQAGRLLPLLRFTLTDPDGVEEATDLPFVDATRDADADNLSDFDLA